MEAIKLPFMALRGIVFPSSTNHIDITAPQTLERVRYAIDIGGSMVFGFSKLRDLSRPSIKDLWETGCEVLITSTSDLQGDGKRIFFEGMRRVRLCSVGPDHCVFTPIEEIKFELTEHLCELAMYLQSLAFGLENMGGLSPMARPKNVEEFNKFIDTIANKIPVQSAEKIRLLRAADGRKRIEILHIILTQLVDKENERVAEQAAKEMSGDNMPAVRTDSRTEHKEVSGVKSGFKDTEVQRLSRLIHDAGLPEEAFGIATKELKRLQMMSPISSDYSNTITYLDVLAELPWSKSTTDKMDIDEARNILNEDHYGLKEPKERILEFLSVRKLTGKSGGAILCFHGPCGVGKTSLGKSIARAMGRKFIRTSLGGVRDEAEIRGHRRTYIGALPGRIIQEMRKAGTNNPVFMLDEVDKLGQDGSHGDPRAALLEVLDPEQNHAFKDNYLELGFDLSQVFFIGTANNIYDAPPALRDRLEIVELPGYSAFSKAQIARRHLIPKQKEKNGLEKYNVEITDEALNKIITDYTGEAGVRTLERCCGSVFRKLAVYAAAEKELPLTVDTDAVKTLLGPPKLIAEKMADRPQVGLSTGLAWSSYGGSILFIEAVSIQGKGNIELTGNLGQVLQESAKAAYTWIKANAGTLEIPADYISQKDIHIHIPAGATPKDGPSAGVALAVSMVSLLSGVPVRNDIAMTGEISLRGRVMPVGGIVEKLLAAHRAGIREAIIPKDNEDLLAEVPEEVSKEMKIHLVEQLQDAIKIALVEK